MILVDSSVWIDYFRGTMSPQTETLDRLLGTEPLAIGDLILTEVLQGFDGDRDFNAARKLLTSLTVVELGGQEIAVQAAKNFRTLRRLGLTFIFSTHDARLLEHTERIVRLCDGQIQSDTQTQSNSLYANIQNEGGIRGQVLASSLS